MLAWNVIKSCKLCNSRCTKILCSHRNKWKITQAWIIYCHQRVAKSKTVSINTSAALYDPLSCWVSNCKILKLEPFFLHTNQVSHKRSTELFQPLCLPVLKALVAPSSFIMLIGSQNAETKAKPRFLYLILKPHGQSSRRPVRLCAVCMAEPSIIYLILKPLPQLQAP